MHGMTEPGDDTGINFIIFGSDKLALGKTFDPCRVDDTHGVSGIMHIYGQLITIGARCLQADMGTVNVVVLFVKPGHECFKPLLFIGEDLVFSFPLMSSATSNFLFAISTPSMTFDIMVPPKAVIPDTGLARINLAHTNSSFHEEVSDTE